MEETKFITEKISMFSALRVVDPKQISETGADIIPKIGVYPHQVRI